MEDDANGDDHVGIMIGNVNQENQVLLFIHKMVVLFYIQRVGVSNGLHLWIKTSTRRFVVNSCSKLAVVKFVISHVRLARESMDYIFARMIVVLELTMATPFNGYLQI